MLREKQTDTSVVYVSTQKQRHKLNILRTLQLADCMDIKYNNTILYNNLHLGQNIGPKRASVQSAPCITKQQFLNIYSSLVLNILSCMHLQENI